MKSQLQKQQNFFKCWNSENNDDIRNALSGIMADDLKFPSTYSVGDKIFTHLIFKFCKDSSPMLMNKRLDLPLCTY